MANGPKKDDLLEQAKALKIKGATRMTVDNLKAAIINAQAEEAAKPPKPAELPPAPKVKGVTPKLQLIQSLVPQVMKTGAADYSAKGGRVKYDYIQEHGIFAVVKPLLANYNVGVLPDDGDWQISNGVLHLIVRITLFDADQVRSEDASADWSVSVNFLTQASAQDDKAANKAHTNAMKYAFQKLFLIATDQLDDADSESGEATSTAPTHAGNSVIAELRARAAEAVQSGAIPNNTIKAHLQAEYQTSKVTDLTGEQAVSFENWLNTQLKG